MGLSLRIAGPSVLATLAVLACGCGGGGTEHVTIRVRPSPSLVDQPVSVDVAGLRSHERATLNATWRDRAGRAWSSGERLRADSDGRVELHGTPGMRFLWSMRPVTGSWIDAGFDPSVRGGAPVQLRVVAGGHVVGRTSTVRRVLPPGRVTTRTLTVRRDGFFGLFYRPRKARRRPAVVVLGGSEGGYAATDLAALLATHGYPALLLAYFKAPGLPRRLHDIPLEYFAQAARWMRRQASVDSRHLVVLGYSRGGEAALLLASRYPALWHGAIGLVPSSQVFGSPPPQRGAAWTHHGRPLRPGTPIPVERISGPVLVAGAGEDLLWDSDVFVRQIDDRLAAHHFPYAHRALVYANAGHDLGAAVPYLPQPDPLNFGGTPAASAAAKADLWPHILDYLRHVG